MKNKLEIHCFLDKADPPDHSFITGMLSKELPKNIDANINLLVSKKNNLPKNPYSYNYAKVNPIFPPLKKGIYRKIQHTLLAAKYVKNVKTDRNVYFVRNNLFFLIGVSIFKKNDERLVFQNSFPLEASHKSNFKRRFHKCFYYFATFKTDSVLGVSEIATKRILNNSYSSIKRFGFIPLLSDLSYHQPINRDNALIKYIYIGTHDKNRDLDLILETICSALNAGLLAQFCFVGGNEKEINYLSNANVDHWVSKGNLIFLKKQSRSEIPKILSNYDIGLSLIPPKDIYIESSPTKLVEYMGAGLAVIANNEIPMQNKFMKESDGGFLIKFDMNIFKETLFYIEKNSGIIHEKKNKSLEYASKNLSYQNYISTLKYLLFIED